MNYIRIFLAGFCIVVGLLSVYHIMPEPDLNIIAGLVLLTAGNIILSNLRGGN